jgi:serine/arginine repetitive matrix protein 2
MVRRGSQSSVGGGSIIGSSTGGGVGRGVLQRNNSSGSMSERTFRSPSPGRNNGAIPAAPEAPPVPALPASLRGNHRRSASTEPPQRMMSPSPHRNTRRGASVDRYGTSTRVAPNISTLPEEDEIERQGSNGSNNSINYSRPMSAQGHSPVQASTTMKPKSSWFTAPTGTLSDKPAAQRPAASAVRSQQAINNVQSDITAAASKPPKKKQIASNTQGTYLAHANAPSNAPVSKTADTVMVYDPASRTFIAKPRQTQTLPEPSPTLPKPAGPVAKPGEYDPNTRKIIPDIPAQKPSMLVVGGDNTATRSKPSLSVEPPPRNPARADHNGSPVSPRAAGILQKQPSIVREDPEGEQEAETPGSARSNKRQTNGFSGFSRTTMRSASGVPIGTRNRSDSLDVPRSASDSSGRVRGSSHSPSRSARFSTTPIVGFTRHDPPERGVSPAKSAMKHSPSSSIRDNSPMAIGAYSVNKAMSETSDTTSVDGSVRKKKSVRVSFTDQPPNVEPPFTPAARAAVARKVSPLIDDDMDEIMKPRPDLPSFGSVRQNRMQQEVAEKVTERPPDRREASSDRAIGGIPANNPTRETREIPSNAPVPPEVTSKSGRSYSSDESDDETVLASELDAGRSSAKAVFSQVVGPGPQLAIEEEAHPAAIKISLQPPTPGEEEKNFAEAARAESPPPRSSLEKFVVPGGWAPEPEMDEMSVAVPGTTTASVVSDNNDTAKSVVEAAIAAPVPYTEGTPTQAMTELQLSDIAESDSDNSAVFSDAEEDLSYMDESGFASMDAIVESPVVKPKKKDSAPESPTLRQAARRIPKEEASPVVDDWTNATSYWKQLSKQQREQIERSHFSSDDEYKPAVNSLANRPKKKKSELKQTPLAVANPQPPRQAPAQPTKTSMRKSMRGPPTPAPAPTPAVHMRSSLREGGGGGMRTSMRDRPQSEFMASKSALRSNHRPSSSGSALPAAAAGGAMSRRPQSPDELSQTEPLPNIQSSKLGKKMPPPSVLSNDSDSESSFKKKRRPSASSADPTGRYSMKRSMRAGSFDSQQQRPVSPSPGPTAKQRKAFSVRSLSPAGSFFGRKQLKESLRAAPADTGVKTLRGPNSMRGSSAKPASRPVTVPRQRSSTSNMATKFKSRFADSDDEDDRDRSQKSSFFRSRFADSDDDEPSRGIIQADLTPVRGIPRRRDQEDGDSTELSDEEDDSPRKVRGRNQQAKPIVPDSTDIEKAMAAARRNLGMINGNTAPGTPPVNEGSALSKGSLRMSEQAERPQSPDSTRKRSFMGTILRRSRTHSNASQQIPISSPAPPLPTNAHSTPVSPRPGKLQRRTSTATQDYFANTNPKTATSRAEDDPNWPLSPPGRPTDLRPSTSDGLSRHEQAVRLARQMRPDIGRSMSNSEDVYANGGSHVGFADGVKEMNGNGISNGKGFSAKTGKKKKFGMLRRAFGLDE